MNRAVRVLQSRGTSIAVSVLVGSTLGAASLAQAQTTPDAGSLRQQIEQPREFALPPAQRPERAAPPPEMEAPAGMTVRVQSFRLAGHTLLSSDQLAPALAEFLGRELGFAGLQRAADAVAAAYRQAGAIARVYLPEQDISAGVVTLQIVEARFAGLRFEGAAPQRVARPELEAYFSARQRVGALLDADALERALLLADDLPGVSVAGTLAPGEASGETALVLQTTDEPFVYGDAGLDNFGARATGSQRLTANLSVSSPGGRGELLSLNLLHTQGSDYGRIALTVPDGASGLRLGVSASSLSYQVIDGPGFNSAAQIQGRSGSLGLDWSYPLVRTRLHNLYFSGGLENKTFYTRDLQVKSDYESDTLRLGLSGNRFDEWGGGGANSASLQLLRGHLSSMREHTLRETIGRHFHKLAYSASRQQTLTAEHSLLVSLQGQHATQVLDSSEKFYIGGAQSVRAYPASELGGERGQLLSAEWRWRPAPAWGLSAFADIGRVVQLPTQSSEAQHSYTLRGQGLTVSWQGPAGLVAKLAWSQRSGRHPKPFTTSSGAITDGDGTLQRQRFWLSASLPF